MKVIPLDKLPDYIRTCLDAGVFRTVCPACQGGKQREESLSIRSAGEGMLKISCWRASCGFYAVSFVDPAARWQLSNFKEGRPLLHETFPIDADLEAILVNDYGLRPPVYLQHGWKQLRAGDLVMPVMSPVRLTRGHMTRTFDETKRVSSYKETSQPWIDWWYSPMPSKAIVIVEDQLSACRLAGLDYTAVALLGTNMSTEDAQEISATAQQRPVYLALDRDAFQKSLTLARRHAHILPMRPVCLDKDIKNIHTDAEINRLFA